MTRTDQTSPEARTSDTFLADIAGFNAAIIDEFRANAGQLGGEFTGGNFVILHTTGAKTGRERLTPLAYLRLPGSDRLYVIAAGPGEMGSQRHPAWYHNLLAHPDVSVEVGAETLPARAAVITGAERNDVWDVITTRIPHFGGYLNNPFRQVPIVALDPKVESHLTPDTHGVKP
jgi:deazaflavin-dependent oxidoreductase (nitroreductase family)